MTRIIGTALSVLAAAAAMATSACTAHVIDGACSEFVPLTYSASQDSAETKSQIRGHNAVWERLCK